MKALLLMFALVSPAFADVVCFQGTDYQVHCVNRGADINLSPSVLNAPANFYQQLQKQQLMQAQIDLLRAQAEVLRKQQEGK